jgi:archaellum biogenesis protein FlaJ (TadC family)
LPCAFVTAGRDTTGWMTPSFAMRRLLLFLVSSILVGGNVTTHICIVLVVVFFGILGIFLILQEYGLVGRRRCRQRRGETAMRNAMATAYLHMLLALALVLDRMTRCSQSKSSLRRHLHTCRNARLNRQAVVVLAAVGSIDSRMIATSQISYTTAIGTTKDDEVVVSIVGQGTA